MTPRNETELLDQTIELAMMQGWRCTHVRPARTGDGWRTPYQGHSGLPDLILARRGVVLLAELKGNDPRSKPTPDQLAWLAAAGGNGYLWRPAMFESADRSYVDGPEGSMTTVSSATRDRARGRAA